MNGSHGTGSEDEQRRQRLAQSIYAATAALGKPDALLSDELADGVDHFLSAEQTERLLPSEECRELAAKFVRELGRPQLACALPGTEPAELTGSGVLPARVADAIDRGILVPLDADCGDRLVSGALARDVLNPGHALGALGQAQRQFAQHAWIREFEYHWEQPRIAIGDWVRELHDAAEALRFCVVIELNARRHAGDELRSAASLFVAQPGPDTQSAIRAELLNALHECPSCFLHVHWYYSRSDLRDVDFLRQIARCNQCTAQLALRPNRGESAGDSDTLSRIGIDLGRHVESVASKLGRRPLVDEIVASASELAGLARAYSDARRERLRAHCPDPGRRRRIEFADTLFVPIGTSDAVCQCGDPTWPPEHSRRMHQSLRREFQRRGQSSPALRWDVSPVSTLTPSRRIVELGGIVGRELASNATAVVIDDRAGGQMTPESLGVALRWALETADIEALYPAPAN